MEPVADNVLRQVDPRWIPVERIGSWLFTAGVSAAGLAGVVVAFFVGSRGGGTLALLLAAWAIVTGGLGWLAERYPRWQYDRTWYRAGPLGIEIRRGVWWRKVINVPRSRIQHTDVAQGPLLRRFGLATLVIHTAGTESASVALGGLAHDRALALRDFLIHGPGGDGV